MPLFEEIAPTISAAGIKLSAVENYFENIPVAPTPVPLTDPTPLQITTVADALFVNGLARTGLVNVAQAAGLKLSQVKVLVKELYALRGAWQALQEQELFEP